MNAKDTFRVLDDAAGDFIPQDTNLLPRIFASIEAKGKRKNTMQPKWKLAMMIALVLLALIALTSAAYAIYRLISDPGLQSVQDAGLTTDLHITAQPSALPSRTPQDTAQPLPPGVNAQTINGVTVTLGRVLLDESRLAFVFSASPLPTGAEFGAPQVSFPGATPVQAWGWSFRSYSQGGKMGWAYVSYQVIHADELNGKAHLAIDIPLQDGSGATQIPAAVFHFDLADVPIQRGQTTNLQQTYATEVNGVAVRLKSAATTPSYSEAVVCYDFPTPDEFWYLQHATIQIGDGPEVSSTNIQWLKDYPGDKCVRLGFGAGAKEEDSRLTLRVYRLVVPLTMQDELPEERIYAANQILASQGIEIAPAPAEQSDGPGGWKFVRRPTDVTDPSQDPTLLVSKALEKEQTGPWVFYVDLPNIDAAPLPAKPQPSATLAPLDAQTISDVTVSLDWVFADRKRLAVQYTINGLPDTPDATALNGSISLKDTQGNLISSGGSSTVERAAGKPGVLIGKWSIVFQDPLEQSEAEFKLDIGLGSEVNSGANSPNDVIAYFEIPPEATPYPPGVFPPPLPDRVIGNFHFAFQIHIYPMLSLRLAQVVTANKVAMQLEKVEMTPSFTSVTLCYPKPTTGDWMLGQATLKVGETTADNLGYRLLFDNEYGGIIGKGVPPTDAPQIDEGRCAMLEFYLGHSNRSGTATLTIPYLEKSVPEVIPDAEMKAAQAKLKELGIEMDYLTSTSASGGGGGGPVFKVKPAGMDDTQAYRKLMEALGYIHAGPWVFVFEVTPEE